MTEIYYAEDEPDIAAGVKAYLKTRDIQTFVFGSIADTKEALRHGSPALLVIDRNLPDGDGMELCRCLRRQQNPLPILCLTVQGETEDIISGFREGADDYVVKPFEPEVLYLRIRALLRRTGGPGSTLLRCGGITLDSEKMQVFYENGASETEEITLSRPEYQLLLLLMENMGRTITRERLLEQIWDSSGNYVNDNTLTVAMKRLREKLHQPSCIKTVRSFGYRMEDTL